MNPTQTSAWKSLEDQALKCSAPLKNQGMLSQSIISSEEITLDYSKQSIDARTHELLYQLAHQCKLESHLDCLFSGQPVNTTEHQAALHTALRLPPNEKLYLDGNDIVPMISATRNKMKELSERIRSGEWLGYTNKPIKNIVHIGIGGSQLGAVFCMHALSAVTSPALYYYFIKDMDPHAFEQVTKKLDPETTLFIVASKSFTTMETIYNAKKALSWINQPKAISKHFIAVTAHPAKANELGIENVLPIWDWVGGRYSVCSAINLITCIAIGYEQFSQLLEGAYSMDQHVRNTPFSSNLPVNLALLGIWNNNFLKIKQLLILTYGYNLDHFVSYIQQLDMESNGKSITTDNQRIDYSTGPIIWGGSGNQAQHTYFQLLCQGTHRIAAEFISYDSYSHSWINQLYTAHKRVLSEGMEHHNILGCCPINHIRLHHDSAKAIGSLVALYEHKIFIQGVIWQINSFDQLGVDSSKLFFNK